MTKVNKLLSECQAGAVLAEDLIGSDGIMILGKDTVLTDRNIESLSRLGIKSVVIKSGKKMSEAELQEKAGKFSKRINKRMRRCEMTPDMEALRDILLKYYVQGLMDNVER